MRRAAIVPSEEAHGCCPHAQDAAPCDGRQCELGHYGKSLHRGGNLEVLKLLQRAYLGKVKMIYIDPPYNTGSDFVYNDDFAMSREEMDEAMGNLDEEGKYTPDWATVFRERDIKHIYFVAETKEAESIAQLHGVELAKIECAARHFEAICQNIHERTV